ncbi:MAG TPA: hypothetical protein VGR28_12780 [Candidatus Thermoplasmatota archaeon]|jgi:hypothetical protein|nr:hypothetical protein [Candidatus Thermoplasmatota archaeon]
MVPREAPPRHAHPRPGEACSICGVSAESARGELFACLLHKCTACVSCCSLIGGPYAPPCKDCAWGKQFWKDGQPPAPTLDVEDAILTYA